MCFELVAKVLNMFNNCMPIFAKISVNVSQDCHASVVQQLCKCRKPFAAKFGEFTMGKFRNTFTKFL